MQKQHQVRLTSNLAAIVDALRFSSDLEATTILARLRLGEPVEEIAHFLRARTAPALPDNSKTTADPSSSFGYAEPAMILSTPDTSADRLAELVPASFDSSYPKTLTQSIRQGDCAFLSVIFPREELRLPITLQYDAEDITGQNAVYSNASVALHRSDSRHPCTTDGIEMNLENRYGPSLFVLDDSNLHDQPGGYRDLHTCWTSYPAVCSSLTIPLPFYDIPRPLPQELPLPSWSIMTANTKSASGAGSIGFALTSFHARCTAMIRKGHAEKDVFGSVPNVAALFDEEKYRTSSVLSQWAASMVHSVTLKGLSFRTY
jgi:hypothetical protein